MDYEALMRELLEGAEANSVDVPVRALLVNPAGEVVQTAQNRKEVSSDPTAHAEIEIIRREAQAIGDWRLDGYTLVVTLEPCVMCAGAIVAARVSNLVFGAWDAPVGGSGSRYDITRDSSLGKPLSVVGGVLEEECALQLKSFFDAIRNAR
jgi:tRNA(adenine34) deaminase